MSPFPLALSGKRAAILLLIFIGFQIGLGIPLLLLAKALQSGFPGHDLLDAPTQLIVSNGLAAWLTLRIELKRQSLPFATLWAGSRRVPLYHWLITLLCTTAAAMVSDISSAALNSIWPPPTSFDELFDQLADLEANPISAPLAIIVMAALTEEFLLRGLLLRGLLRVMRPWRAIWLTALLFAIMHLNPWQAPIAITLGLIFGWIYYRTGSIWLCVTGHALNNAIALLSPAWFVAPDDTTFAQVPLPLAAAAIPALILGIVLLRRLTPTPPNLILPNEPPPLPPS